MLTTERPETRSEVIKRLMQQGGYILVAGGDVRSLPEPYRAHEQIILWDDEDQDWFHKQVPSNTRAIVCNIWMSHPQRKRLKAAADALHIPIFVLQTKREIREMLDEIIHQRKPEPEPEPEPEIEEPIEPAETYIMKEEDEMAVKGATKTSTRRMAEILAAEYNPSNTVIADEARRLMPILKSKYGVNLKESSVNQAIYTYRRNNGAGVTKTIITPRKSKKSASESTAFEDVRRMIADARAALDLVAEALPKLEEEVNLSRERQKKLREFLLGE